MLVEEQGSVYGLDANNLLGTLAEVATNEVKSVPVKRVLVQNFVG